MGTMGRHCALAGGPLRTISSKIKNNIVMGTMGRHCALAGGPLRTINSKVKQHIYFYTDDACTEAKQREGGKRKKKLYVQLVRWFDKMQYNI
jgi:hypothetical protein